MFDPVVLSRPGTVLLDSARPSSENGASWCFAAPKQVLKANTPAEIPALLDAVERVTSTGSYVAGYLSYEAGYGFVDLEPPSWVESPVGCFGVYDRPELIAPPDVSLGLSTLDTECVVEDAQLGVTRAEYIEAVEQIRRHIGEGDVYQVNYTTPVRFRAPGDPRVLYRHLRRRQRVPYAAYLNFDSKQILSCSPELFFQRKGRQLVTRPMKGTIRRGRTLDEDQSLQAKLASDPKNRAENLMIVDLLRNDLSVCCEPGSVEVPALYTTETYDTVTQMTSTVQGRMRSDQRGMDVLRALFPCGSVTGAPKRRAMRLIRSLEQDPRGVYCGAIGMVGPDNSAVFSVPIRTVELDGEVGRMGVGSGIVWDSEPEEEYEECELKTQFFTSSQGSRQSGENPEPLRLIETMRFDGIRLPLLDRHVTRLERSAAYFDYPFDEQRFRRRVDRAVSDTDPEAVLKVRATLDEWGRMRVETAPLRDEKGTPWVLTVAEERADRDDPLFYHKTTHRAVYDRSLRTAQEQGYDEALLLNEEGQVTEGAHSSIFLQRGDQFVTPPVECGLLAGVFRAYVLETKDTAKEQVLTLDEVREADAVYCCNAVRGWCRAELAEEPVETRT